MVPTVLCYLIPTSIAIYSPGGQSLAPPIATLGGVPIFTPVPVFTPVPLLIVDANIFLQTKVHTHYINVAWKSAPSHKYQVYLEHILLPQRFFPDYLVRNVTEHMSFIDWISPEDIFSSMKKQSIQITEENYESIG
ncbi:hypothetical protein AVEN_198021-1 [Araneus ventricosus]|uniref:Uncharacterized protein n=1 Tax=Araneus ventricosus TaxID=182803 RepID=A0A4Y2KQP9_ARAVE|nr:hypothetical protein AVEN_198021-1 [Araneus ventricosus]